MEPYKSVTEIKESQQMTPMDKSQIESIITTDFEDIDIQTLLSVLPIVEGKVEKMRFQKLEQKLGLIESQIDDYKKMLKFMLSHS